MSSPAMKDKSRSVTNSSVYSSNEPLIYVAYGATHEGENSITLMNLHYSTALLNSKSDWSGQTADSFSFKAAPTVVQAAR